MALTIASLTGSPGLPGAAERDYPPTAAECAAEWRAAIDAWASAIVPVTTTVTTSGATLETALLAAFTGPSAAALASIVTGFTAWALTIGTGMLPGFVAVPPPLPLPLIATLLGPMPTTRVEGVSKVASAIDIWAKTGTATPSGGGAPILWS